MSIARTYGRKFIGKKVDQRIDTKAFPRDAELFDIVSQGLARVNVKGTSEKVLVHYPENWENSPNFAKKGQSVRIAHRHGLGGLLEIEGLGQTIPQHLSGSSNPVLNDGDDAILTGGHISEYTYGDPMEVAYESSTYRIGGADYSADDGTMILDSPPAEGNYRYDILVAGEDGVIDYVKGNYSSSDPVIPNAPADHIRIGDPILVVGGLNEVSQWQIGAEWHTPAPTYVLVTATDPTLSWSEASTAVRVTVYNQYGRPIAGTDAGWYLTLEITDGNGTVYSVEEGSSATKVGQHSGTNSYSDFTYTRDQLSTDDSPRLVGSIEETDQLKVSEEIDILLLGPNGNPMGGDGFTPDSMPAGSQVATWATAVTIDFSLGATCYLELTDNCSLTFSNMVDGGVYRLMLRQKGSGSYTVSAWNGIDNWSGGGTPPTLSTAVDTGDAITIVKFATGAGSEVWAGLTSNFPAP